MRLENQEYLNLQDVAERFGMKPAWKVPGEELRISSRRASIDFSSASREIDINGMRLFLGEPALLHRGRLYISQVDFETTLQPILMPQARVPAGPIRTIAIDAGHGGRDPGTRDSRLGLLEKDMTLSVALRLREVLEKQNYRVVLTRSGTGFVELKERSARAVAAEADLFISIHFNAVGNPAVRGTETYLPTPRGHRSTGQAKSEEPDNRFNRGNDSDHWNTLLAFLVQRQLLRDLGTFDRGIKRARFKVLRGVNCPAVLVEAGYLSNPREAAAIATGAYQDKLAHSLAAAINQYQRTTENISAARR